VCVCVCVWGGGVPRYHPGCTVAVGERAARREEGGGGSMTYVAAGAKTQLPIEDPVNVFHPALVSVLQQSNCRTFKPRLRSLAHPPHQQQHAGHRLLAWMSEPHLFCAWGLVERTVERGVSGGAALGGQANSHSTRHRVEPLGNAAYVLPSGCSCSSCVKGF
jgi:hypothetical protein